MEYTQKLGFPIPEVTRAGDVNDVIDNTNGSDRQWYINMGSIGEDDSVYM